MGNNATETILTEICGSIEIPDTAYDWAEARYRDLGKWFGRPESACSGFQPHISSQGSFCLGTVIRPLKVDHPYDLDLVCNLKSELRKSETTQEELKRLVRTDIERYRIARGIEQSIKEKHRCWRLEYADELRFHMDVLPCIPDVPNRQILREAMVREGFSSELAERVASLAVSITDDRHPRFREICEDWFISNPAGFSKWFESRVKLANLLLEKRLLEYRAARVDDLPTFRWKLPLQRVVQLLKRHRDFMFVDACELKPASNILTTLAGLAYAGEASIVEGLSTCLENMGSHVNSVAIRVPNPVNPVEDFADRWSTADGRAKKLEENFWRWLDQARADFDVICNSKDADLIRQQISRRLGVTIGTESLTRIGAPFIKTSPRVQQINEAPARPWRN